MESAKKRQEADHIDRCLEINRRIAAGLVLSWSVCFLIAVITDNGALMTGSSAIAVIGCFTSALFDIQNGSKPMVLRGEADLIDGNEEIRKAQESLRQTVEGSMCASCRHVNRNCGHLDFASMRAIESFDDFVVVRCEEFESRRGNQ